MSAKPPTRSRRPSAEVRSLLLDAARELFLAKGYEGTTTMEISVKAGVSERLLFNNFGSKAELFEVAILSSFAEFVEGYTASWERESAGSTPEDRVEALVNGLFELAEANRGILRSALAGTDGGTVDGPDARLLDHWAETLQSMQGIATAVREVRGYRIDPPASIAAAASMVFGMVLLDDLLYPSGSTPPSRQRRIDAMVEMLLHGLIHSGD